MVLPVTAGRTKIAGIKIHDTRTHPLRPHPTPLRPLHDESLRPAGTHRTSLPLSPIRREDQSRITTPMSLFNRFSPFLSLENCLIGVVIRLWSSRRIGDNGR